MHRRNLFQRAAQAQIAAWEAELATQPDLFRAARLCYEIGRLFGASASFSKSQLARAHAPV